MSRVEWTRRTPEEIETVLGILLCRENPAAIRIRPAQGDHGIDVYVPGEDGWVVYQIKSFATKLTPSQKRQITKSWNRFQTYAKENGLIVGAWHLVRPINPTLPETKWLADLTQGSDHSTGWKGLDFCEGLAAKYPDVLDYYLFDGKTRLEETIRDFLVLAGFPAQVRIEPGKAYDSLEAIHDALNAFDPHFRYDFLVQGASSEGPPQSYSPEPGLVAGVTRSNAEKSITFRIYARFREALSERELPGAFSVEVKKGSAEAIAWQDFLDYGIGVDSVPVKNFTLKLPGNLGGEFEGGLITIGSLPSQKRIEFDLVVLDADGSTEVASTYAVMEGFTSGLKQTGYASSGREVGGAFSLDLRVTLPSKIDFRIFDIGLTGKRPADILDGYRVLAAFRPPNLFQMHIRHGPPLGSPHPIPSGLNADDVAAADVIRILEALAIIQRHTHLGESAQSAVFGRNLIIPLRRRWISRKF